MSVAPMARERRHTLYFLREVRAAAPVFLDTEVDMTAVRAHRAAAGETGRRYSPVAYVIHAAGRALALHPEANAALRGRLRQRVATYPAVNAKVTFDKSVGGHRVVVSAVMPSAHEADLDGIQRWLAAHRDADLASAPEFAGVRALHRMPRWLGGPAFRSRVRPLTRRADLFGTVAVTSLGHGPVDGFHSLGGTTVTLGVGRILDRPVARDGRLAIAPVMRLSLAFDHRVIDGAEAADVLADVRAGLETFVQSPVTAGDAATPNR